MPMTWGIHLRLLYILMCLAFLALKTDSYVPRQSKIRAVKYSLWLSNASPDQDQDKDPIDTFKFFERLLFERFAESVSVELTGDTASTARNFKGLMNQINTMAATRPLSQVNAQGRSMLVRLFPGWLLPAFKVMFAKPFPTFSAWMNCVVTKWTTDWLMGPAEIQDLELADGVWGKEQLLVIKKCRFLESTGCARTCLHACKMATQEFFLQDMSVPVTLRPNFTDYSCRMEFGVVPLPLEEESDFMNQPCLSICTQPRTGKVTHCLAE